MNKELYKICNKCNGTGLGELSFIDDMYHIKSYVACNKCNGEKTLNWLEDIFGKPWDGHYVVVVENNGVKNEHQ